MSDEQEHKLEAKSDYVADASSVSTPDIDAVPEAELPDQELYHSHSWWTTYVFSQDAKYIGIQYALDSNRNRSFRISFIVVNENSVSFPRTWLA